MVGDRSMSSVGVRPRGGRGLTLKCHGTGRALKCRASGFSRRSLPCGFSRRPPRHAPTWRAPAVAAPPAHRFYDRTSRWLDCLLAAGILVLGSPLWLAIAVAIKLT